jgi:hypothetical protein
MPVPSKRNWKESRLIIHLWIIRHADIPRRVVVGAVVIAGYAVSQSLDSSDPRIFLRNKLEATGSTALETSPSC